MRNDAETRNGWKKLLLATVGVVALAFPVVVETLTAAGQATTTQSGAAGQPKFEVVSIKVNKSGGPGPSRIEPGGRYTATGITLTRLVTMAYQLIRPEQISMPPNWADSEQFDIEAKTEDNPNPTRNQFALMVQGLLADRFKLVAHHETRQFPVYLLVLAKPGTAGPRLVPHTDNAKCWDPSTPIPPPVGSMPPMPCGGILFLNRAGITHVSANLPMDRFAANLSGVADRIVLDRTGLTGAFDIALEYTSPLDSTAAASDPSAPPAIFTALQDQLGLKLEPATGPIDVLVIDHVEEPSPN